jgi:hypothetical protein
MKFRTLIGFGASPERFLNFSTILNDFRARSRSRTRAGGACGVRTHTPSNKLDNRRIRLSFHHVLMKDM